MAEVNNFKYPDFSSWGFSFPKFEFETSKDRNTSVWENYAGFDSCSQPFINIDFSVLPMPKFEPVPFIDIFFPPMPAFPPMWDFSMTNITLPSLPLLPVMPYSYPVPQPVITSQPETKAETKAETKTETKPDKKDVKEQKTEDKTKTKVSKIKNVKINSKISAKSEEIQPGYYVKKFDGVNIQGLKPYMKEKLVALDKKAKELGYELVVSSGYRSHSKQSELKRENSKLAASPYRSAHEYGAAIDIWLYKNGKKVNIANVPGFGEYAESIGLVWGAKWNNQYEPWHFNIDGWKEMADIRDEYRRLNHIG